MGGSKVFLLIGKMNFSVKHLEVSTFSIPIMHITHLKTILYIKQDTHFLSSKDFND